MAEYFEVAIIGAGPGGLSAAANAAHHNLSHVLFEKGEIANTIHEYQLRKHVMAEPAKLPLRSHIKFEPGTREETLQSWIRTVHEANINVRQQTAVSRIEKTEAGFKVFFGNKHITCKTIILAIGAMGTPRRLEAPGSDLPHVTYRLADPGAFEDEDIIVVGAGDAAIENALALADKNRVSIINRKGEFARAKDANAALIKKAIDTGKVCCYYNSTAARIEPKQIVINTPDGEVVSNCTHLIARLGGIMPRKFLEECGIEFPSPNPTAVPVVDSRYESNVKGLYLVGSLIGYPLIKQAINQGYEVIEHILGNPIEPSDQVLIEEKLNCLPGTVNENLEMIRNSLPLFRELSDPQFRELVSESTVHVKKQGDLIFQRNDYTDTFFSIISGSVKIELPDHKFKEIETGNFFGEAGLLSGRRRAATIRMYQPGLLLETPRKQMLKLISSVESVKRDLDEISMFRATQTGLFPYVTLQILKDIISTASLKQYQKGQPLFREGDEANTFFVIRKGSVKISRLINDVDVTQSYLPAGHYVGEMAILNPDPTPCRETATAAVACETIVINKSDFLESLEDNPIAAEKIRKTAKARLIEDRAIGGQRLSGELLDFMIGKGLSDADNVLLIDSNRCVGCDNCEQACAATHDGFSRLDRKGGESFASIQIPISCRHCENPLCMIDCPPDALARQPNGEITIKDSCIGCGNCEKNCPYDVIQMVYEPLKKEKFSFLTSFFKPKATGENAVQKAAKCDLCTGLEGGPACVRSCPTGAAMRVNPAEMLELTEQEASKENILNYKHYRWFWLNLSGLALLILFYFVDDPVGGKGGNTLLGYIYGGLATLGIITLMGFGIRKRSYSSTKGTVTGWLSAHIWIGLSLLLIVPMHSGFQFNLNVHTLAYGLLVATIASGIWGAHNYVRFPPQIPSHRGDDKTTDLADQIMEISLDLARLEQNQSDQFLKLIDLIDFPFKPRLQRLIIFKTRSKSSKEKKLKSLIADLPEVERDKALKAVSLVSKKRELMGKLQQDISVNFWMKVWLYFHLPLSFALILAVTIHIFLVFYYW
ncbi:MAG: NAD(P)-binding domain-containing protein [Nitrospinales bacterium]